MRLSRCDHDWVMISEEEYGDISTWETWSIYVDQCTKCKKERRRGRSHV